VVVAEREVSVVAAGLLAEEEYSGSGLDSEGCATGVRQGEIALVHAVGVAAGVARAAISVDFLGLGHAAASVAGRSDKILAERVEERSPAVVASDDVECAEVAQTFVGWSPEVERILEVERAGLDVGSEHAFALPLLLDSTSSSQPQERGLVQVQVQVQFAVDEQVLRQVFVPEWNPIR
jgi:hypothetical protein